MTEEGPAAAFLAAIGAPQTEPWRAAFARMAAAVREAMSREPLRRRDAREGLEEAARTACRLRRILARREVQEAMRILAPADPPAPDLAAALADLESRARRAAAMVPRGQGEEPLDATLGRPSAPLLAAACVAVAWRALHGRMPSPNAPRAAEACEALWTAAGGEAGEMPVARWAHHLATVRGGRTRAEREAEPDGRMAAAVVARLAARDLLARCV